MLHKVGGYSLVFLNTDTVFSRLIAICNSLDVGWRPRDTGQTGCRRQGHIMLVVMRAATTEWRTQWTSREARRCKLPPNQAQGLTIERAGLTFFFSQVCYSWWVFATLSILGRGDWISQEKLQKFILSCQDTEKGGVADRPEDVADIWHTVFGLAGLSLMGYEGLQPVDPVYCLPASVTKNLHQ